MGDYYIHRARFFNYIPSAVNCLAYEDTLQKLAVARSDNTVEVWNTKDWSLEVTLPPVGSTSVEALSWYNNRLFSASVDGYIYEYNIYAGNVKHSVAANGGSVWCMAVNKEKKSIAVGTDNGYIVLMDICDDGLQFSKLLNKQEGKILSLVWYEPEDQLITGGENVIRIWSCKSGIAVDKITLPRSEKNKDTLIWKLAVTKDYTIIVGDSMGVTSFWNGRNCTRISSFQSHKSQVLCVCVNDAGDVAFSSGIDPTLTQFKFVPLKEGSENRQWVWSTIRNQHTHDVRALAFAGNCVVSAGVDCSIIYNRLDSETCRKIPPISNSSLVELASSAKIVMLRYTSHLELWKLGSPSKNEVEIGEFCPLKSDPLHLLQLKSINDEYIVCASISANADYVSYSCVSHVRLFNLKLENDGDDNGPVSISVTRVRLMPTGVNAARCMTFSPDGTKLVVGTRDGSAQVIGLDPVQPSLLHTIQTNNNGITDSPCQISLLAVSPSGKYLAMASGNDAQNVDIYHLKKEKLLTSLPHYVCRPTALAFDPKSHLLAIVYTDRRIFEYDIVKQEYTEWSRRLNKNLNRSWLKRHHNRINCLRYHPNDANKIVLSDDGVLCIIDKNEPIPKVDEYLFRHKDLSKEKKSQQKVRHGFHITTNYQYILHSDVLDEKSVLVVEQPQATIFEALAPTLKRKHFGT